MEVVEWTDIGPIISTNDSAHKPPPWNLEGPSHPEKEEKAINISLGYKVLPLYMGPTELCRNVSQQTWALALPLKEDFWTLLGLFTALSLSMNHVYTTETLGKELGKKQRMPCKGFTNKNFKYIPIHWDKCQANLGKLALIANLTIDVWGPHNI